MTTTLTGLSERMWFAEMQRLAHELHDASHRIERFDDVKAAEAGELFSALCDVLDYLTNSMSWDQKHMMRYDMLDLTKKLNDICEWRLRP